MTQTTEWKAFLETLSVSTDLIILHTRLVHMLETEILTMSLSGTSDADLKTALLTTYAPTLAAIATTRSCIELIARDSQKHKLAAKIKAGTGNLISQ